MLFRSEAAEAAKLLKLRDTIQYKDRYSTDIFGNNTLPYSVHTRITNEKGDTSVRIIYYNKNNKVQGVFRTHYTYRQKLQSSVLDSVATVFYENGNMASRLNPATFTETTYCDTIANKILSSTQIDTALKQKIVTHYYYNGNVQEKKTDKAGSNSPQYDLYAINRINDENIYPWQKQYDYTNLYLKQAVATDYYYPDRKSVV